MSETFPLQETLIHQEEFNYYLSSFILERITQELQITLDSLSPEAIRRVGNIIKFLSEGIPNGTSEKTSESHISNEFRLILSDLKTQGVISKIDSAIIDKLTNQILANNHIQKEKNEKYKQRLGFIRKMRMNPNISIWTFCYNFQNGIEDLLKDPQAFGTNRSDFFSQRFQYYVDNFLNDGDFDYLRELESEIASATDLTNRKLLIYVKRVIKNLDEFTKNGERTEQPAVEDIRFDENTERKFAEDIRDNLEKYILESAGLITSNEISEKRLKTWSQGPTLIEMQIAINTYDPNSPEKVSTVLKRLDSLMLESLQIISTLLPGLRVVDEFSTEAIYDNWDRISSRLIELDSNELRWTSEILDLFADKIIEYFYALFGDAMTVMGISEVFTSVLDGAQASGKGTFEDTIKSIRSKIQAGEIDLSRFDEKIQEFFTQLTNPRIATKATGTKGIAVPSGNPAYAIYEKSVSGKGATLGNITSSGAMVSPKFMHILVMFETIKSILQGNTGIRWDVYPRNKSQVEEMSKLEESLRNRIPSLKLFRSSIFVALITPEESIEMTKPENQYEASYSATALGFILSDIEKGKFNLDNEFDMNSLVTKAEDGSVVIHEDKRRRLEEVIFNYGIANEKFYRAQITQELTKSRITKEHIDIEKYILYLRIWTRALTESFIRVRKRSIEENRTDDANTLAVAKRLRSHYKSSLPDGIFTADALIGVLGEPEEAMTSYLKARAISSGLFDNIDFNSKDKLALQFNEFIKLFADENYITVWGKPRSHKTKLDHESEV